MTSIPIDTHKAVKKLQEAGVKEEQAEVMISIFGEIYGSETATKTDLDIIHKDIKADFSEVKTDIKWMKKFMFGVGMAVLIAALKYIFTG